MMITTQRMVTEYVRERQLCSEEKIVEIIGGVMPRIFEEAEWSNKRLYGVHKQTLDICFAAFKYSKDGREKGFPVFIETAKALARKYPQARFHVIGGFGKHDADISEIKDRVTFHGPLKSERLASFYLSMDMMISPTQHGLVPGHFDGFPTGASIEAAMSGVMLVASDTLNQNVYFTDGAEMLFVEPNAGVIVEKLERYLSNPKELYQLARNGQNKFRECFGYAAQMNPRIAALTNLLPAQKASASGRSAVL